MILFLLPFGNVSKSIYYVLKYKKSQVLFSNGSVIIVILIAKPEDAEG